MEDIQAHAQAAKASIETAVRTVSDMPLIVLGIVRTTLAYFTIYYGQSDGQDDDIVISQEQLTILGQFPNVTVSLNAQQF